MSRASCTRIKSRGLAPHPCRMPFVCVLDAPVVPFTFTRKDTSRYSISIIFFVSSLNPKASSSWCRKSHLTLSNADALSTCMATAPLSDPCPSFIRCISSERSRVLSLICLPSLTYATCVVPMTSRTAGSRRFWMALVRIRYSAGVMDTGL
eukprot:7391866-Prymnesium_polylepis.1